MFGSEEIKALEKRMGQVEKGLADVAKGVTDLAGMTKDLNTAIANHKEHCRSFFAGYNKEFDRVDKTFKDIDKAAKALANRVNTCEIQLRKMAK